MSDFKKLIRTSAIWSLLGWLAMSAGIVQAAVEAKTVKVDFSLPEFNVPDYRKPYVAIWAEYKETASGKKQSQTMLLWHLTRMEQDKWLVDIRRWWRKAGRYGKTPDALTSATKGPGEYSVKLDLPEQEKLTLFIEVVREDGGRTLLKQKLDLSKTDTQFKLDAGDEIGPVTIRI